MTSKVVRYNRPDLEIEFDQAALNGPACCRFVPIVVRLCHVPFEQHVLLTVTFERVRTTSTDEQLHPLDDYVVSAGTLRPITTQRTDYVEYRTVLLARAHREESGTIRIHMQSSAFHDLSHAVIKLDSRVAQPVFARLHPGSFRAQRMLPRIRDEEERTALLGEYPSVIDDGRVLTDAFESHKQKRHSDTADTFFTQSLFPTEE